jgi:hypothetical protein
MQSRHRATGWLLAGALALACGGSDEPTPSGAPMARQQAAPAEERADNAPPQVERVVLNPQRPLPGHRIEARIDVSDPDGDPIRLEIEWRHAGRVIASGRQASIAPEGLRKGDELAVTVTATDGRDESAPVTVSTRVGNQAPVLQDLYLTPEDGAQPGQTVTAVTLGYDPDGDTLEYEFTWLLNDRPVRGADAPTFDTRALARGDKLKASARVTDGTDTSPERESKTMELANRPPRIAGAPLVEPIPGGVQGQLEAEDPDGDVSLRFRVLEGPPGLAVDSVSGRLTWKPEPGTTGTHPVEVAVADSFGAESALRFELQVSARGEAAEGDAPPAKGAAGGGEEAESDAADELDADADELADADEDADEADPLEDDEPEAEDAEAGE